MNVPLRLVPTRLTAATITTEIPPAIRAYSIAVAPDSSFTKREMIFVIWQFHVYTCLVKLTFSLAGVLGTVTLRSENCSAVNSIA